MLAVLAARWTYPQMFGAGFVIALGCLAVVACAWRAHLPRPALVAAGAVAAAPRASGEVVADDVPAAV